MKKDLQILREQNRQKTNKMYIIQATEEVIRRKGFGAMTMDDIAEESQFSKATLYKYFNSKSGLILEIVKFYINGLNNQIKKIRASKITTKDKLKSAIRKVVRFHNEKQNISRVFIMDKSFLKKIKIFIQNDQKVSSFNDKKLIKEIKAQRKEIICEISEILSEGIEEGIFCEMDISEAITFLESALQGFCYGKYWRRKKHSTEDETNLIYNYFLHGIEKKR